MSRPRRRARFALVAIGCPLFLLAQHLCAQKVYTWEEVREKFRASNPTIQAAQLNVSESRAAEVTAYLRPNPEFSFATDGTQITPNDGVWRPFAGTQFSTSLSYLHERERKRELRRDSAHNATSIAESNLADQERTLLFNLRNAFVQILQAKAVLGVARESLSYYDRLLDVSRDRLRAGDIAQVDLDRLELQRVQFATDVINATTNLTTAKIQLRALLNDRTPLDQLDFTGSFDFVERLAPLDEFRTAAFDSRPDLKAAVQAVDKANADHKLAVANGSVDPTFSAWYSHNPSFNNPFANNTLGASVNIPLRIFDRNQGEKARSAIDISRNQRLREAAEAQIYGDVDSAYNTLGSNVSLLRLYKADYLARAVKVRETVSFAYQRGGVSLLDFLQAQQDYRMIQLSYVNLVGSYLTAASQMNLAVGKEILP
jgi:outer membrane protein, heavy metal efflux system